MATVGPTLEKPDDLRRAIEEGARWFRFPCGYRQRPHVENARAVRAAAVQTGVSVQLLLDLPSSRPRTGPMQELRLAVGDRILIWDSETSSYPPGSQNGFAPVPLPGLDEFQAKLAPNHAMWFCDGRLRFVVEQVNGSCVVARMVEGTTPLKSSNSLFLPDSASPFAPITPPDRALLQAFAEAGLAPEWVALSLIASPEDVWLARREMRKILGRDFQVMAKFETMAAVECAQEIIRHSDGLMVARGDLALAVGYIRVPEVQEHLVAAARKAGKVSVVATQVLEGFAETGLPQRAELSDLSLIARQRAGAVMLGKETVYSPRPIECIRLAVEVLTHETHRFEAESRPPRAGGPRRASAKS
jgi:pyruvate kinase